MKRFYKSAEVAPCEGGFAVHLDGKPVRTPSRQILLAPSRALADEIVKEWQAQVNVINPETMPLTQILTTAMDCVTADRAAIAKEVLNYLNTDLLLYRAVEPEAVVGLQNKLWGPWVARFETRAACRLLVTTDLQALKQPQAAHDYAKTIVEKADHARFTAIQMVTAASGSIILALAFVEGDATPEDVFNAAQLEELYRSDIYNEAFYGKAPHQEKAQAGLMRDLRALRVFLDTI